MLKLKLQYFGHLMQRTKSFERLWHWKRMKAGEGDDRGWGCWIASPTRWPWVWASSGSWWWTGKPGMLQSMGLQRVGHDWVTELNWTESFWASLVAQLVKSLPAMWETWVRFMGWEDPLEKGKVTHSSILAWRIPWTVWSHKESNMTERFSLHRVSGR